jgi:membrane protease YdiL (CAAX protease family)
VSPLAKVCAAAIFVIIPLVAAQWILPPGFPLLLRQILLCAWGVGVILAAERLLFSDSLGKAARAVGFAPARLPVVAVALLVSAPMWGFLPLLASSKGIAVAVRPDWPSLLLGVVLVNGIAEEVIHRGFVFGHVRRDRTFAAAALISGAIFTSQHLYLIATMGWMVGLSSVLLAAFLAFPLAFMFERGGHSLGGPAILHTSSNAPVMFWALPPEFIATALVPHMGVVLVSLYLVFGLRRTPEREPVAQA